MSEERVPLERGDWTIENDGNPELPWTVRGYDERPAEWVVLEAVMDLSDQQLLDLHLLTGQALGRVSVERERLREILRWYPDDGAPDSVLAALERQP